MTTSTNTSVLNVLELAFLGTRPGAGTCVCCMAGNI